MKVAFTILGEPASKANSRKLATVGAPDSRRMLFIKSEKARSYEHDALRQIPSSARQRFEGPVKVTLRIFYASERPDLDESIVLDVMQDRWKRIKPGNRPIPAGALATREPNPERVLIQAGVYRNDRQVREKHVYWGKDKANPRAEIEIEPMQAQQDDLIAGLALEELPF